MSPKELFARSIRSMTFRSYVALACISPSAIGLASFGAGYIEGVFAATGRLLVVVGLLFSCLQLRMVCPLRFVFCALVCVMDVYREAFPA